MQRWQNNYSYPAIENTANQNIQNLNYILDEITPNLYITLTVLASVFFTAQYT